MQKPTLFLIAFILGTGLFSLQSADHNASLPKFDGQDQAVKSIQNGNYFVNSNNLSVACQLAASLIPHQSPTFAVDEQFLKSMCQGLPEKSPILCLPFNTWKERLERKLMICHSSEFLQMVRYNFPEIQNFLETHGFTEADFLPSSSDNPTIKTYFIVIPSLTRDKEPVTLFALPLPGKKNKFALHCVVVSNDRNQALGFVIRSSQEITEEKNEAAKIEAQMVDFIASLPLTILLPTCIDISQLEATRARLADYQNIRAQLS